jgi:hypothetical protein
MVTSIFDDSIEFASNFLWIYDKEQRKIPLVYNKVQKHYLNHRTKRDLVLKARQFGISTAIEAEFYRIAVTQRASIAILAHDDDTTQKLRRMSNRFHENMPESFRPNRKYANDRLTTYTDFDSEIMIATAGNTASGRGGTYSHVHGSEVAFWKDAKSLIAGIMQGGKPYIVLESTPNGAQGYFYELCMDALDKKNDWNLLFYEWWFDGQYKEKLNRGEAEEIRDNLTNEEKYLVKDKGLSLQQIKWRRLKIRELKHLFLQEYPEHPKTCFLLSGTGYFGDLTDCFSSDNYTDYNPDFKYYAGLDFGQVNDYTVLSVVCRNTKQQVALIRLNKLGWGEMRRQIVEVCKKYNVRMIWAEKNSMGSTNIEELRKEFTIQNQRTKVKEFITSNNSKHEIMTELHEALHEDGLKLLAHEDQMREFQAFVSKQTPTGIWQLAASGNEHDDCVIATALSWQASIKSGIGFG